MSLSTQQFHDLLDQLYNQIEDALDHSDLDIDSENNGNILTLELADSTRLILSRQEPLRQLWLAAPGGGFHFDYQPQQQIWFCQGSNQELFQMLNQLLSQHSGSSITLL